MTYLAYWIILAICSYCLGKSSVEKLCKPYGGVVGLMDKQAASEGDKSWETIDDGLKKAVAWTMLLILCLLLWPLVLLFVVYYSVFPERFIEEI